MPQESDQPSADDLRAVAEFTATFEAPGFVAGEWCQPETGDDGVIAVGWWRPADTVMEWERGLYDHHIVDPDGDYLDDEFAGTMRQFVADAGLLSSQGLRTVRAVLTNITRGERFCEGYMAGMFVAGVAQAATRRLGELVESRSDRE